MKYVEQDVKTACNLHVFGLTEWNQPKLNKACHVRVAVAVAFTVEWKYNGIEQKSTTHIRELIPAVIYVHFVQQSCHRHIFIRWPCLALLSSWKFNCMMSSNYSADYFSEIEICTVIQYGARSHTASILDLYWF